MKRSALLVVALLLLGVIGGCSSEVTQENMGYDTAYNTELGVAVTLGMKKDKVDELLGVGVKSTVYYNYIDSLQIDYADGIVSRIVLSEILSPWVIKHGLSPFDKVDEVYTFYGEEEIFDSSKSSYNYGVQLYALLYNFDKNNKPCDVLNIATTVSFYLTQDQARIESIALSKK